MVPPLSIPWPLKTQNTVLMKRIEEVFPDIVPFISISHLTPPRSRRPSSLRWSRSSSSLLIDCSNDQSITEPSTPIPIQLHNGKMDVLEEVIHQLKEETSHTKDEYSKCFHLLLDDKEETENTLKESFSNPTIDLCFNNISHSDNFLLEKTLRENLQCKEKKDLTIPKFTSQDSLLGVEKDNYLCEASIAITKTVPRLLRKKRTIGERVELMIPNEGKREENEQNALIGIVNVSGGDEASTVLTRTIPRIISKRTNITYPVIFTVSQKKKKVHKPSEDKENSENISWREIEVSCKLTTENTTKKMLCQLPHFVLYDLPDQEASQVIRMIFAHSCIPYEMRNIHEEILIDFPLRSVPVLEIDGVKIGNNTTICRHLGWRYDLSGQTALDDSRVDMIAETIHESRSKLKEWFDHIEYKKVDYQKPECSDVFALECLEGYLLPIIENILRKSDSPWLVGHKVTWADLMVADFFNPIIYHRPEFFDNYPNVYLHNKKIAEIDQLKGMLYNVRDRKFI